MIGIMEKNINPGDVSFRFGNESDRDEIRELRWLCHLQNPHFFYPDLTEQDDLEYNPQDCALSLVNNQIVSVGYVDMNSEDFHKLAELAKISPNDMGEVGLFTRKKFSGLGFANNSMHRAIKHLDQLKKRYVCFCGHPEHERSVCLVQGVGGEPVGGPFHRGGDKTYPLRQLWVAEVKKALLLANESQQRGSRLW